MTPDDEAKLDDYIAAWEAIAGEYRGQVGFLPRNDKGNLQPVVVQLARYEDGKAHGLFVTGSEEDFRVLLPAPALDLLITNQIDGDADDDLALGNWLDDA